MKHPQQMEEFRALVTKSRTVKFWSDFKDIQLAIINTLNDYSYRPELIGWVRGSEAINTGFVAEEIAKLAKENAELRNQLKAASSSSVTYNDLTFEQAYRLLDEYKLDESSIYYVTWRALQIIITYFEDTEVSLLHWFWLYNREYDKIDTADLPYQVNCNIDKLIEYGFLDRFTEEIVRISGEGKRFLIRLRLERKVKGAEKELDDNNLSKYIGMLKP